MVTSGPSSPRPSASLTSRSARNSSSFLHPTGVTANAPVPKPVGPVVEILIFLSVVIVRAAHPVAIDASKSVDAATGEAHFRYHTVNMQMFSSCILFITCFGFCYLHGGTREIKCVWKPMPLVLLSLSGVALTAGNFLEMASMGRLHGTSYQVLQQSKIVLTAFLLMCVKGVYQTRLQWILLCIIMLSVSAYMDMDSRGGDGEAKWPILGMLLSFMKVLVSCAGGVAIDKYMKVYTEDSTHVHIARFSIGAVVASMIVASWNRSWNSNFFADWDDMTYVVAVSFVVKNASTLYILGLLDSILKNIAEAAAILLIYSNDVFSPWAEREFRNATFLVVLIVVAACAAYIDTKAPVAGAVEPGKVEAQLPLSRVSSVAENGPSS